MIRLWMEDGALYAGKSAKPRRKPGHALLKLICGGICNTDLELLRGYYTFRGQPTKTPNMVIPISVQSNRNYHG